jgi:hypothetical protein
MDSNSDVLVLSIRFFEILDLSELWVCFGSERYLNIMVHTIYSDIGSSVIGTNNIPQPNAF